MKCSATHIEAEWLDAALRALIIPVDPAVSRVESDIWGEWAINATDDIERIVLEAAARIARMEQSSERRTPPVPEDVNSAVLADRPAAMLLGPSGVMEGFVQARQMVLFGLDDLPVGRPDAVPSDMAIKRASGHAAAHRSVLLRAIEMHAANVPVWRWLSRWYGALALENGRAIEGLNTFGWAQSAYSCTLHLGVMNSFVQSTWAVIDRIAAASVCYTRRSADFTRFTLTSLRGTGLADALRPALPAPRGVMHSIPLTVGEVWNGQMAFRSPDRAPADVFATSAKFHAFELEVVLPEPVWAHMPSGQQALKDIQPHVPGKPRITFTPPEPKRLSKRRTGDAVPGPVAVDIGYGVIDILDDPPRYGSPFLGEVIVRDPERAVVRPVLTLPQL
ncbi:MAG: hypothetical protein ACR2M1_04275 [Gemmatimonadaceae bacterium]